MREQSRVAMRGNHYCVRYPDYDAAIAWWRDTFDFRLGAEFSGSEGLRMCYLHPPGDDHTMLQICGDGKFTAAPTPSVEGDWIGVGERFGSLGPNHYCFDVDDADAAVEHARAHGVKIVGGPVLYEQLNTKIAFWVDPWGNMFEFSQAMSRQA